MSEQGARATKDPRQAPQGGDGPPPGQRQAYPGHEAEMRPAADHGEESYRGAGKLEGKVALITGADSGIGRAVALAYAREGADVAIGYGYTSEEADAEETLRWVEDAGRRGVIVEGDVSRRDTCDRIVEATIQTFGSLDILVNNAAYQCETDDFLDIGPEQLEKTFRTNIFGYIWMAQAAVRHMEPGSVILNTGSVTALEGHDTLIDYSATKGAIHTFTKSLAQALSERGIRVNCVAPGPVWTPLIPATLDEEHVAHFGESTAWGRPAQPAEIAPSYVFLASDDGRFYTGEVLAPTGRTATR